MNRERPSGECVKRVPGGHLDGPDRLDTERLAALLTREGRYVLKGDLGVEAPREHPLMLVNEFGGDVDVIEL